MSVSSRFRSLSDPDSLREFAKRVREGMYIISRDGVILDANPAFLEILGAKSLEDFRGRCAADYFVDPSQRTEEIRLLERDGSVREFEIALKRLDGEERTVLDTCYLIEDPETGEAFVHGILVDITSRKRLEAELREMSTRDALTGALNRRYLFDLEERFAADPELRCGCIFIDIDNFKKYNDLHGHQEGDEVLKRMTRFLMRCTRAEEAVVRIGGDEFVVILNNAESEDTRRVAERLRTEAETQMPISFSLGWATRESGEPVQRLLDRADHGLLEVRVVKRQSDPRMIALAR